MTEEQVRKMVNDIFDENIMNNLDSSIIFKYIEGLEKENQELKKQLEEKENQQKGFIEYLEDEIKRLEENNIYQPLQRMALETYKHNLLKYREIIGDKK